MYKLTLGAEITTHETLAEVRAALAHVRPLRYAVSGEPIDGRSLRPVLARGERVMVLARGCSAELVEVEVEAATEAATAAAVEVEAATEAATAAAVEVEVEAATEAATAAAVEVEAATATAVPRYMTTEQAAAYLRVSERSLRTWRAVGTGPPVYRLGARYRYERAALDAWLDRLRATLRR